MNDWVKQNKIELIILSVIVIVFSVALYLQIYGFYITFTDTDDYMRVVRIRDFFESHDLSNNIIKRCNVPFGCSLHWTRFYDFFLIIPSYILNFFTDSINTAIDYVCFCIGPIIRIAIAAVFLKMIQKYMSCDNAFLCAVMFIVNPIIAINGIFGRPDHHSFILLFMLLLLYKIIEACESDFKKHYISSARLSAICIWISPETLIPLFIIDGILFLYALRIDKNKSKQLFRFLYLKSMMIAFDVGLIILCSNQFSRLIDSLCILIGEIILGRYIREIKKIGSITDYAYLILFFWVVIGLHEVTPVYYDEISIVHHTLYICIAAFFNCFLHNHFFENIFARILFCSSLTAIIFLSKYPNFIYGMGAGISPYVKEIWLSKIGEMRSPFETGNNVFFSLHFLFILLAAVNKIYEILHGKYQRNKHHIIFWQLIIANSLIYVVLSAFANRMLIYSSMFSLPLIVDLGMNSAWIAKIHRLLKIIITFFMSTLFIFAASIADEDDNGKAKEKAEKQENDSRQELFAEIDNLSKNPVVIMAHSNDGPMILYYTKHSAVGAPYHRQEDGIISSYEVMENTYSEENVKKILLLTDTSYIFIRKSQFSAEKNKEECKNSLARMIINQKYPKWIQIIKLSKKFDDIIVAKIDKTKLREHLKATTRTAVGKRGE